MQPGHSLPTSPKEQRASVLGTAVNKLWSEKLMVPGDWGSVTSAWDRPSLKPGAARKGEGTPTKLRRKVGQEPMEVVAWHERKRS